MKFQLAALVSFALAPVHANSVGGGPGYATFSGYNYEQHQGQQNSYGQPGQQAYEEQGQELQQTEATADFEESTLPPGWSEHFDPNSGQYYYYNAEDGTTTWDKPMPEPPKVQPPKENERQENVPDMERAPQKSDESFPLNETKDYQPNPASRPGSQENQVHSQNSWMAQQTTQSPESFPQQTNSWESNEQPQQQPKQPEASVPTNTQSNERPHLQPQDWTGNNIMQDPGRETHGPGSFDGKTQPQQDQGNEQGQAGSPPTGSGWGTVQDRTPSQPTQHSSGWVNPKGEQSQHQNSWNTNRGDHQKEEPEQVVGWGAPKVEERPQERPQYQGQPIQGTRPWGVPNPEQGGQVSKPEDGRPFSPNEGLSSRGAPNPRADQSGGQHRQQQTSPDRPPPQQVQEPINGQQRVYAGQIPQQIQRPVYGAGQTNQYGQSPMRYDGQYPYGSPQPYGGQFSGQHQAYGQSSQQQQVTGQGSVIDDSTAAVKDALNKSWQGLLGFSNRTRDAMGLARDQVVTGASTAGQTISEKSTTIWGQAKSALGSVFEKSDDAAQAPYSMSRQHSPSPSQNMQQGGYPGRYGTPPGQIAPGQYRSPPPGYRPPQGQSQQSYNNNYAGGRYGSPPGRGVQQSQPPQQTRPGGPPMQPRTDAPYPHQQSQTGTPPPRGPYQAQYGNQGGHPRASGTNPHHGQHVVQGQQQGQPKHDPWSHPGLSSDM